MMCRHFLDNTHTHTHAFWSREDLPVANLESKPFSSLYLWKQSAITAEYRCPR